MSSAYLGSTSLAVGSALLALAVAGARTLAILRAGEGTERMRAIAEAIREGAVAFLRREYTVVAVVGIAIAALIVAASGRTATGPSSRWGSCSVPQEARPPAPWACWSRSGPTCAPLRWRERRRAGDDAVRVSWGSVTGLGVAGLAMLELVGCYALFGGDVAAMVGLLFGASLISLFARVGGGIYTKGADVGADLVGKLETEIPEDDPRNPA